MCYSRSGNSTHSLQVQSSGSLCSGLRAMCTLVAVGIIRPLTGQMDESRLHHCEYDILVKIYQTQHIHPAFCGKTASVSSWHRWIKDHNDDV